MVGFWRSAAPRAGVLGYREQGAQAGRGAGRPELDLLGYAPRSRRLAQLLWKRKTASLPLQADFAPALCWLVSYSR